MLYLDHLPGATTGEQTVALLRRHWVTLTSLAIAFVLVLILPIGVFLGLRIVNPDFFIDPIRTTLFVLGLSIFFLFAWLFLFQNYLDYYLDMWIVTNHRVLNIEQHGLFARTVSELRLDRVQDVTAEVNGFIRTMFDYGTVYIQTAGEKERFMFEDIPHPNHIAKVILDLSEKQRREHLETAVEEFNVPNQPKS